MLTQHQAKIQSAIRSAIIAVASIAVAGGVADDGQTEAIMSFIDKISTPEIIGAAVIAATALWGIFDPNKKQGNGDPK